MTIQDIINFIETVIPSDCDCRITASTSGAVHFTGINGDVCKAVKKAVGAALVEKIAGARKLTHTRVRGYRCWRLDFPSDDLFRCGIKIEITKEELHLACSGNHKITRF